MDSRAGCCKSSLGLPHNAKKRFDDVMEATRGAEFDGQIAREKSRLKEELAQKSSPRASQPTESLNRTAFQNSAVRHAQGPRISDTLREAPSQRALYKRFRRESYRNIWRTRN